MILDKIVESTRQRVLHSKNMVSHDEMKASAQESIAPFVFEKALAAGIGEIAFICEVKKASPSKGIIVQDFPYVEIAVQYEAAGANAISVLTEPEFFLGCNKYLSEIKAAVNIPVLRKDFIVDEYQIYESRAIGADAVLLICSILDTKTIRSYLSLADSLGLSCLVEAHDEKEVMSALEAGARIIGVNNRDLKTFSVDINNSIALRSLVPDDIIFVSESGVSTPDDVRRLCQNKTNAVLIGETLMKSSDKKLHLDKLRGLTDG